MDNETLAYELAKEYTFRRFNFSCGTPEELLEQFQDAESKIYAVLEKQDSVNNNNIAKAFLDSDDSPVIY